jgi:hypothetical protein
VPKYASIGVQIENALRRLPMYRFTIRGMLWLTAVVAIALTIWRVWPWIDAQRQRGIQRIEPYHYIIPGG